MERVIAYVDGWALHAALRDKGWQRFYWLDVQALARRFLDPGQELVMTRYFTALVGEPEEERKRQAIYLEALQTLPRFHGYYVERSAERGPGEQGSREFAFRLEQTSPVEIAVELLVDVALDRLDAALLFSADSSLAGVVSTARRLLRHRSIVVVFPPGEGCMALQQTASNVLHMGQLDLRRSQLPDRIEKEKGVVLLRPEGWE